MRMIINIENLIKCIINSQGCDLALIKENAGFYINQKNYLRYITIGEERCKINKEESGNLFSKLANKNYFSFFQTKIF